MRFASVQSPKQATPIEDSPGSGLFGQYWFLLLNSYASTIEQLAVSTNLSVVVFGAKGDGVTDDSAAIARAIAKAKAEGGGSVYFPAGVYNLATALPDIDSASNITLFGDGCQSIILAPPVTNGIAFNITNSDHITVRNLLIKGASAYSNFGVRVVDSSDITVVDNVIEGGQCGIRFIGLATGCLRLRAERNIVRGLSGPDSAIAALGNVRFVWLVGNLVDGSGQEGVTLDYSGGANGLPQDCVVANNIVRNTGRFAVSMYHVRRVAVTGNTMYNTGLETLAPGAGGFGAIDAATDTATSSDCNEDISIVGNTIEVAGYDGIRIEACKRFTVANNVIRTAGHAGILVFSSDITPNIGTITGNAIWGTTPVTGAAITAAIRIDDARNVTVSANAIDNNTAAGVDGIRVSSTAQYIHVADNSIDRVNNAAYTLYIQGTDCSAAHNRLYPGPSVDLSGAGIVQSGNSYLNGTVIPDGSTTTQHVVTGSRAIGSTYQNTTGKPMTVTVTATGTGASTVITGITAYSDTSTTPAQKVAAQIFSVTGASYTGELSVTFQVPNNSYYKIVGNNSPTLTAWIEWY